MADPTAAVQWWWGVPVPASLPQGMHGRHALVADMTHASRVTHDVQVPALPANEEEEIAEFIEASQAKEPFSVPGHPDIDIRFVNLVYNYPVAGPADTAITPDISNDVEDEDFAAESDQSRHGRRHGVQITLPILSMRQMQRSWLALGYRKTKTKGSNAIGIKYTAPWKGAHFVNSSGRVQCEGIHNRRVDRALLVHRTCMYVRGLDAATGGRYQLGRPMCQNMVAKCYMPMPRQLCIGLLHARNLDICSFTHKFMNIVVHNPAHIKPKGPSLLVYAHGKVLCVGARSTRIMLATFASMMPRLKAAYRTPENISLEANYMDQAIIAPYRLPPEIAKAKAKSHVRRRKDDHDPDSGSDSDEPATAATPDSLMCGAGRAVKLRVMGYVL